jgi:hypothetical protein
MSSRVLWVLLLFLLGGAAVVGRKDTDDDYVPIPEIELENAPLGGSSRSGRPSRSRQAAEFRAWFEDGGGEIGEDLSIRWDRRHGFHYVATRPVGVGALLAATPHRLQLHADSHGIGSAGDTRALWTPIQRLAFALGVERLHGADSYFAPYLALLPVDPAHAATMRAGERAGARGSSLGGELAAARAAADGWAREAVHYLADAPGAALRAVAQSWAAPRSEGGAGADRPQDAEQGTWHNLFRWSAATVASRAFFLPATGEAFLAPGSDLFGHSNELRVSASLHLPERLQDVIAQSDGSAALLNMGSAVPHVYEVRRAHAIFAGCTWPGKGEQVFVRYDHNAAAGGYAFGVPNAESLPHWGFATENNRFDAVDLSRRLGLPSGLLAEVSSLDFGKRRRTEPREVPRKVEVDEPGALGEVPDDTGMGAPAKLLTRKQWEAKHELWRLSGAAGQAVLYKWHLAAVEQYERSTGQRVPLLAGIGHGVAPGLIRFFRLQAMPGKNARKLLKSARAQLKATPPAHLLAQAEAERKRLNRPKQPQRVQLDLDFYEDAASERLALARLASELRAMRKQLLSPGDNSPAGLLRDGRDAALAALRDAEADEVLANIAEEQAEEAAVAEEQAAAGGGGVGEMAAPRHGDGEEQPLRHRRAQPPAGPAELAEQRQKRGLSADFDEDDEEEGDVDDEEEGEEEEEEDRPTVDYLTQEVGGARRSYQTLRAMAAAIGELKSQGGQDLTGKGPMARAQARLKARDGRHRTPREAAVHHGLLVTMLSEEKLIGQALQALKEGTVNRDGMMTWLPEQRLGVDVMEAELTAGPDGGVSFKLS